ncbi:MAG: hypothetical protein J0M12_00440 [Deltaproteobacteria bacterium]|nr:hypothetical protein [Deltaproteobacteria bacterium]
MAANTSYNPTARGSNLALELLLNLLLVAVVSVDLISPWSVEVSWHASWIWIAVHIVLFIAALGSLLKSLLRPVKFLSVIGLGIALAYLYLAMVDARNISHEATQQVACVLKKWAVPDHAFGDWCFLGYPARSYYLNAFPTLLFGPSQLALNFGFASYFIIGLLAFVGGILSLFKDRRADLVALLAVALLLHSNHFDVLLLNFEQSFVPTSYALMVAGFFLHFVSSGRSRYLTLTALALYLSIYAYTPALALSVLALILLPLFLLSPLSIGNRRLASLLGLGLIAGIIRSLWAREDLKLNPEGGVGEALWHKLGELGSALTTFTPPDGVISLALAAVLGAFTLLTFGIFLLRLYQLLSRRGAASSEGTSLLIADPIFAVSGLYLLLCVWAAAVAIASILSPGYAKPPPAFAIHRATFVLPLLIACGAVFESKCRRFLTLHYLALLAACIYFGWLGCQYLALHQSRKAADPKIAFFKELRRQFPHKEPGDSITILMSGNLRWLLGNTSDYAEYLWPQLEYYFYETCREFADLPQRAKASLLITEAPFPDCAAELGCEVEACENFSTLQHTLQACKLSACRAETTDHLEPVN